MIKTIKVAARSDAALVAGAIAGMLREGHQIVLQAVGANAVNQMVKAAAIARSYLVEDGLDLLVVPDFTKVRIGGIDRTALRLLVYTSINEAGIKGSVATLLA